MLNVNDIVKFKFRGAKHKFKILGPNDIITENCYFCKILDELPLCYEETLSNVNSDLSKEYWNNTQCIGDTVSNNHTHRIYIEMV